MIKHRNKISKFSAYIVLLGYLTITTANVFHHHNIDLGKLSSSINSSEKNQNKHLSFIGSEIFCVVHFAYSSVNNSLVAFDNSHEVHITNSEIFDLRIVSPKPIKETNFSFCLRAPPFSIS